MPAWNGTITKLGERAVLWGNGPGTSEGRGFFQGHREILFEDSQWAPDDRILADLLPWEQQKYAFCWQDHRRMHGSDITRTDSYSRELCIS